MSDDTPHTSPTDDAPAEESAEVEAPEQAEEPAPSKLSAEHAAMLKASGIEPAVAEGRGYRTVKAKAELERLGFKPYQRSVPTLLVPIWGAHGEIALYHHRPDQPRFDSKRHRMIKYEFPGGARMAVDVHPSIRTQIGNPKIPLFLTEGAKKADAAISRGLCCAALIGTWNWRGTNEQDGKTALPDWEYFAFKDRHDEPRTVYLCFDSDVMEKQEVYAALVRLSAFVKQRGGSVRYVYLPPGDGGAKTGLDDYLAAGHTVEELMSLATTELRRPPKPEGADEGEEPPLPYSETPHGIVHHRPTEAGTVDRPLTNFTARIVAEREEDDGAEATLAFEIEAQRAGRRYRFAVPASAFASLTWAVEQLGAGAVVSPGIGAKDHTRAAIQLLSGDPPRHKVYRHTGWRNVGPKDEPNWVYLHAAGAIGNVVPGSVAVSLPDALARYALPEPPTGDALHDAVAASMRLLDLGPDAVVFPLFAAIWRAVLGPVDCSVFVVGPTGAFKSEAAALAQQHFGAGLDRLHLPANWSSTDNFLEGLAFHAKDALLVVDDFAPRGSMPEINRFHAKADRVLRGQGNRSGRGRLRADATPRPPRPPRGLLLSTGEDVPAGVSLKARNVFVEVEPGVISRDVLTRCQQDAAAGLYAAAMSAFLAWLAPQYGEVAAGLKDRIAKLRDRAATDGHRRTPENTANLGVGLRWFLQFAVAANALTDEAAKALWKRGWAALVAAAREQEKHQADSDPVHRFWQLLGAAMASGRAHVARSDGSPPPNCVAWGWRERSYGVGENACVDYQPQGDCIGYVGMAEDDEAELATEQDLYLIPDAAYRVARQMGNETAENISLTHTRLWKAFRSQGMLVTTDERRETLQVRKVLAGNRRNVLHVRTDLLMSRQPDQPDHSDHDPPFTAESNGTGAANGRVCGSDSAGSDYKPDHAVTAKPAHAPHDAARNGQNGRNGRESPHDRGTACAAVEWGATDEREVWRP